MTPNIQAILFDLEDTLLDNQSTRKAFLVIQWQSFLDELLDIPARRYVETLNDCFIECGGRTQEAYAKAMFLLGLTGGLGALLHKDYEQQGGGHPRLFPEALDLLRDLSKHFKIGLVSNGRSYDQLRILRVTGLLPYFHSVSISDNSVTAKPAPDLFLRCLHELGVPPSSALMVGDNRQEDICPAAALGMKTVWKHNRHTPADEKCKAAEVIEDLCDLPYVLRNALNVAAG
jgi:HAD superfamily hydrolase (TIGR01549 family)